MLFGRQISSFEGEVKLASDLIPKEINENNENFHGVFIRAPGIASIDGPDVKVLGTVKLPQKEEPVVVAVEQNNIMATAFHPELTDDIRWHQYFLQKLVNCKTSA